MQLKMLRDHTKMALETADKTMLSKTVITQLIEQLLLHQLELELQNNNLIEAQAEVSFLYNKYSLLYELAPIGCFTLDEKGLITEVNEVGANLLGIEKAMLLNRAFIRYVSAESHYNFSEYRLLVLKDDTLQQGEIKLLKKDGSILYAKLTGKAFDRSKSMLMIVMDMGHLKQQEKQSQQDLKLSHLNPTSITSGLISTITNELNQPLSVIANYVHGCIRRLEADTCDIQTILAAMHKASRQLNRINETILRMKNFIFKESLNPEPTCINTLISEALILLKHELFDFEVALHYVPNKSIGTVLLDKLHIQQVILNLARNSIEAMRDACTEAPKLTIEINCLGINSIEVCVLDNGPGFVIDHAHKLFEPHFTTKPYGTGLGLAISRTIIEWHKGKLSADISPLYGTRFRFTLPA